MPARSSDSLDSLIALERPATETLRVPVLKVFDGDGFLTRIDLPQRDKSVDVAIRCGFIDAPEMGQPGGKEARDFLASLIDGKLIDLAILTKMDTGGSFDRHGRIVAVPYLPASAPLDRPSSWRIGQFPFRNIELEMILNGWAWVLERYGPDERYFVALAHARAHRRGIWAFDSNVHPWEFKRQQYALRGSKQSMREQLYLFPTIEEAERCPQNCGGTLHARSGRFGAFWGCSNYPRCRYTRDP